MAGRVTLITPGIKLQRNVRRVRFAMTRHTRLRATNTDDFTGRTRF